MTSVQSSQTFGPARAPGIHLPNDFQPKKEAACFKLCFNLSLVTFIAQYTNDNAAGRPHFSEEVVRPARWIMERDRSE